MLRCTLTHWTVGFSFAGMVGAVSGMRNAECRFAHNYGTVCLPARAQSNQGLYSPVGSSRELCKRPDGHFEARERGGGPVAWESRPSLSHSVSLTHCVCLSLCRSVEGGWARLIKQEMFHGPCASSMDRIPPIALSLSDPGVRQPHPCSCLSVTTGLL